MTGIFFERIMIPATGHSQWLGWPKRFIRVSDAFISSKVCYAEMDLDDSQGNTHPHVQAHMHMCACPPTVHVLFETRLKNTKSVNEVHKCID